MAIATKTRPTVFLSSVFHELVSVRKRVKEAASAINVHVWVAEIDDKKLPKLQDDLTEAEYARRSLIIAEACMSAVREADAVLFIAQRYGSAIFPHVAANVSILELELFQAVLHLKPVHIIELPNAANDVRLDGLVELCSQIYPGLVTQQTSSQKDAFECSVGAISHLLNRAPQRRQSIHQFADQLRKSIIAPSSHSQDHLDVRFLDCSLLGIDAPPVARERVEQLIQAAGAAESEATRLAYLWVAIRNLAAFPYNEPKNADWLPLWESVLKYWASAAAWYGLHGWLKLGRLAAVNSLREIQKRISDQGGRPEVTIQAKLGAVASEHYSMAKLAGTKEECQRLLETALAEVSDQLARDGVDRSGLLLIKGPIELQLGRRLRGILSCYQALRIRKAARDNPRRIGEAESHLGLACALWPPTVLMARRFLERGVHRLAQYPADGFLVTAKKKLGYCRLVMLDLTKARQEFEEAMLIARERCYFDQMLQLDSILGKIPAKPGRLRMIRWIIQNRQILRQR